jgi:hypothetical protein
VSPTVAKELKSSLAPEITGTDCASQLQSLIAEKGEVYALLVVVRCVLRRLHRVDALGAASSGRVHLNGEFV